MEPEKKQIPEKVLKTAKWYIDRGWEVVYLATDEGKEYYYLDTHGAFVGFPIIFLYADGEVLTLDGTFVVEIFRKLADKGLIPGEDEDNQ